MRALAIRENKIHAVGIPDLKLEGTPVFLDVEGLPDRDFYYLIGVRIQAAEGSVQHSFWADDAKEEKLIWNDFLGVLSEITNPHLIHYGSYETTFLKRMCRTSRTPTCGFTSSHRSRSCDKPSFVHLRADLFPDVLQWIEGDRRIPRVPMVRPANVGARNDRLAASMGGIQGSCVEADVAGLQPAGLRSPRTLANRLVHLHRAAPADGKSSQGEVVLTSDMKPESPYGFRRNEFVFPEMETINKAAYWDYQRERVYVKSRHNWTSKRRRNAARQNTLIPNTTIEYSRPTSCPACRSALVYGHGKISRTVIDLRFMRYGIKRWITRHVAHRYRCQSCRSTFHPKDRRWTAKRYGPNLTAYTIYLNIELRLPQGRVSSNLNKLFGLCLTRGATNRFKADAAEAYRSAYNDIMKRLCSGRLLHVDETSVSVKGKDGYVWVLTSLEDVAYFYTPTRAGETIHAMLKDFSGVLVSDFYAAYDGIDCPQQKCLIHLIRDLNEELLKHPYDDELKQLVGAFAGLVKPMIETVDQRGLKKRFLGKHQNLC